MLAIHQGGRSEGGYRVSGCPGLSDAIVPILAKLDPAISVVVSGHTHEAYACELPASDGSRRLLTSGGRYGYFVSDIRLQVDPRSGQLLQASARNVPVTRTAALDPQGAGARRPLRHRSRARRRPPGRQAVGPGDAQRFR